MKLLKARLFILKVDGNQRFNVNLTISCNLQVEIDLEDLSRGPDVNMTVL